MKPIYDYTVIRKRIADHKHDSIDSPDKAARRCIDLEQFDREHLVALYLDTRLHLIGRETVHVGTADSCIISPREIFRGCLLAGAVKVILVHNHPSGNPDPSAEDIDVAEQFEHIGKLLHIEMVDFMVVGNRGRYWSHSNGHDRLVKHQPSHQKPLDNYLSTTSSVM